MRIAIDIDDTLTNTSELLVAYTQKYDYEILKRKDGLTKDKVYTINGGSTLASGMNRPIENANAFKKMYHETVLENANNLPFFFRY